MSWQLHLNAPGALHHVMVSGIERLDPVNDGLTNDDPVYQRLPCEAARRSCRHQVGRSTPKRMLAGTAAVRRSRAISSVPG